MKAIIMRLVAAIAQFLRRMHAGEPANPYEGIAFTAFRSMLAVAFFPPPGVVADARR